LAVAFSIPAVLLAAEACQGARGGSGAPEVVDLFPAMDQGQILVRLIAKDDKLCTLAVRNRTSQPLSVRLPTAFGGVPVFPVLAQQAAPGLIGSNASAAPLPPGPPVQPLGIAPPGTLFPPGGTQALLNVPPEGFNQFAARAVCLDRAKGGPSPFILYQVRPLSQICNKPELVEICRMLSTDLNRRVVQAAAWHVANNLDWQQLLHRGTMSTSPDPLRFAPVELMAAQRLVAMAQQTVQQQSQNPVGGGAAKK
jgi:hypothetical protein